MNGPSTDSGGNCARHPDHPAAWRCPKCEADLCEQCVTVRTVGRRSMATCQRCGELCQASGSNAATEVADEDDERSFWRRLPEMPTYPFRGQGWAALLGGGIAVGLLTVLAGIPLFGLIAIVILLGLTLYIVAYGVRIIETSAMGDRELPEWPDISSFGDDVIVPLLKLVYAMTVCFAPAYIIAGSEEQVLRGLLLAGGAIYFPMAMLAVVLAESFLASVLAVSPHLILPAIVRCWRDYPPAVAGIVVLELVWEPAANLAGAVPFLGDLLYAAVAVYFVALQAHIIGAFYHANRYRIGWFEQPTAARAA